MLQNNGGRILTAWPILTENREIKQMVTVCESPLILSSAPYFEMCHVGIMLNADVVCSVMFLLVCYSCGAKAVFARSSFPLKSL